MKRIAEQLKELTFLKIAAYFFILAVCAKAVYIYVNNHPSKDELLYVRGTVTQIRLGGQGKATNLEVKSRNGTHIYSSYYGKVWPGMDRIEVKDKVEIYAERNKLNKNEFISGKRYYIWELIHKNQIIINYDDVMKLVHEKESIINRYINYWLVISIFLMIYALLRRNVEQVQKII